MMKTKREEILENKKAPRREPRSVGYVEPFSAKSNVSGSHRRHYVYFSTLKIDFESQFRVLVKSEKEPNLAFSDDKRSGNVKWESNSLPGAFSADCEPVKVELLKQELELKTEAVETEDTKRNSEPPKVESAETLPENPSACKKFV